MMCNVKAVTHLDKPTEEYQSTLKFLLTLLTILASCSLLFWFYSPQLYCFGSLSASFRS